MGARLVTGGFLLACGGLAASRGRTRASGLLLAGAGAAWFLANLVPAAVYLHRALLAHAALTYPSGRARGNLERAAILMGYALALLQSLEAAQAGPVLTPSSWVLLL